MVYAFLVPSAEAVRVGEKNRRDHAVRRRYAARATGVAEAKARLTVLKSLMTIAVGGPAYAACFEDMLSDCSCVGASLLGASKLK